MKRIYLNAKFHRVILIVTIISLTLLFLISLKPVFAADPIAVDDAYTTPEDIEKLIDAPGVAANDSGDVGTLTVLLDSNPLVGNLTLDKTGAFTYTPPLNYNGLVTFTYHLTDALGTSSPAVVTITVTAVNDPPTALDDSNTTAEDTAVATDVLANDSDVEGPLDATSLAVVTAPSNGTTEVSPTNGVITYTPIANFNGNDSFVYQVYDNGSPLPALPVTATVNLLITAVNDAPIAGNDSGGTTDEATPVNIGVPGVLANDTDPDFDAIHIDTYDALSTESAAVTLNANGSYSYDPSSSATLNALAVGESVIDSFSYTIADTTGLTATAVVTFNVTGLNDSPVAADVNAGGTTNENTTLNVSAPGVLLGDTDPDTSDTLQAVSGSVTSANGASVSINSNGSYAFNPTGATALQSLTASGSIQDTFTYTVTDGHSDVDTAVVTVTVTGVNDAPVLDNSGNMLLSNIDEDNKTSNGDTVNTIVLSAGGDRINDVDDLRDGIAVTGVDNTNGTWQYSINDGANWIPFGSVSNFTAVLLDASGSDPTRIRFVPDTNYNGSAGNITFRAWDQTDGFSSGQTGVNVFTNGGSTPYSTATETATLTVNSVNDAPVLDNSGTMVLTDILEDASTILGDTVAAIISSAGGNRITDVDAGAVEGIAVIGIDNTNGNWQYKTQTGTWQNLAVSPTSATLLAPLDRLRFMPDANYHGSAGAVTFQAWDQTTGTHGQTGDASVNGGTTAFSTAVETATLTVISVNDKPVLDLNGSGGGTGFAATFTEDGGPVTIVDTDLSVDDADNNNLASATITLTNPLDGLAETLAVNTGSTNISANYNSTSGILSLTGSDTLLNYQTVLRTLAYNNISQNPTVIGRIVEIVVNDSIDNSNLTSTFITVESQNDAPILDTNTTLFVNEGGSGTISVAHLLVTDVDNTDTQLVYTLSSVPAHGQLFRGAVLLGANDTFTQQDINNNSITYTHDASETTSDSFIFTVSDSSGGSIGATTFDISINSSNDTPILVTNAGLSLNEGAGKTITSAFLKVTDTDNTNSELTYHIEIVPTNGIIAVNGVIQGLNGTFTQADINNNRVTYTHDGSETTSDSFTFRVEDGVGGVISSTVFNIAVTPVNDAPIVDLNGTVAAGQDYTGTFVEDGGAVSIVAAELSVTDVDNTNLVSARVSLTNHPNGSAESLSVSTSGTSITANYSSATGILSLSGTDTVAHYQSVLRSLKYNNTSQDPSTVDRVVTIVVNDSLTDSNTATSVVSITAINDLPTLTVNAGLTVDYAHSGLITNTELKTIDLDNTASELVYSLQSPPLHGSLKLNGTSLTANDTFTQNDINNNRLAYEHDKTNTESDSFSFTLSDGDGGVIATKLFNIVIRPQPIVYLPAILNNYVYSEPNDTACEAFGVSVNHAYQFLPDDTEDWYKFTIGTAGPISVHITNYSSPDGQLLVYSGSCSALNLPALGQDPAISPSGSLSFPSLAAGTYYVRVYTAVIPSNPTLYTLTVSRP